VGLGVAVAFGFAVALGLGVGVGVGVAVTLGLGEGVGVAAMLLADAARVMARAITGVVMPYREIFMTGICVAIDLLATNMGKKCFSDCSHHSRTFF
jgi:hypothetical protein